MAEDRQSLEAHLEQLVEVVEGRRDLRLGRTFGVVVVVVVVGRRRSVGAAGLVGVGHHCVKDHRKHFQDPVELLMELLEVVRCGLLANHQGYGWHQEDAMRQVDEVGWLWCHSGVAALTGCIAPFSVCRDRALPSPGAEPSLLVAAAADVPAGALCVAHEDVVLRSLFRAHGQDRRQVVVAGCSS